MCTHIMQIYRSLVLTYPVRSNTDYKLKVFFLSSESKAPKCQSGCRSKSRFHCLYQPVWSQSFIHGSHRVACSEWPLSLGRTYFHTHVDTACMFTLELLSCRHCIDFVQLELVCVSHRGHFLSVSFMREKRTDSESNAAICCSCS